MSNGWEIRSHSSVRCSLGTVLLPRTPAIGLPARVFLQTDLIDLIGATNLT